MHIQHPESPNALRGRAAQTNDSGRFETQRRSIFDDGWSGLGSAPSQKRTRVHEETPRAILTQNQSPDVPFEHSINAYRGCEHGCIYCFARPSHNYMGLSAGQDFETDIFAKPNAAQLLEREITRPGYAPRTVAIGTNTDPYQPIEKEREITRQVLEVLAAHDHPVSIVTKNHMVTRDIDILERLARKNLVQVSLSVTTLNPHLARAMEPRASTPQRRLEAVAQLAQANIPVGVMVAPIIPALTDHEVEWILAAAAQAGATSANHILLRLPGEVADLFRQWLHAHVPDRASRVLKAIQEMRGGRFNDPRFGHRMRGSGPRAHLLSQRFKRAARQHGLKMNERFVHAEPRKARPSPRAKAAGPTQLNFLDALSA